jgi:hypothetical protein
LTRWLYRSTTLDYQKHEDLIWVRSQKQEKYDLALEPKDNDFIVYYDCIKYQIIGIFKIDSSIHTLTDDAFWDNSIVYHIVPYLTPPQGHAISIENLQRNNPVLKSLFQLETKTVYEQITEDSFNTIKQACLNPPNYRKAIESTGENGLTGWKINPDLLAGLLDYYNSRAVSFASLLVASVFGLITLSAIIQIVFWDQNNLTKYYPLAISIVLYLLFSGSALYMLKCYSYYTRISDLIKTEAINKAYFSDLKKLRVWDDDKKKDSNLAEIMASVEKTHGKSFPKGIIQKWKYSFGLIFSVAVVLLALFIYWQIITQKLIPLIG